MIVTVFHGGFHGKAPSIPGKDSTMHVSTKALAQAATLLKAGEARSVPLLANIVVECDGEHLILKGFDYETATTVRLDKSFDNDLRPFGPVLVSAALLVEALRGHKKIGSDSTNVTIAGDDGSLFVEQNGMGAAVPRADKHSKDGVEAYPMLPAVLDVKAAHLYPGDLAKIVKTVAVVASVDDMLPALTGVQLAYSAQYGEITAAATDRFRLARAVVGSLNGPDDDFTVLVPASVLKRVAKYAPKAAFEVYVGGGLISLVTPELTVSTRVLDNDYPRLDPIIDGAKTGHVASFTAQAKRLADAVKGIGAMSSGANLPVNVTESKVSLPAEKGTASAPTGGVLNSAESFEARYDSKKLASLLGAYGPSENVTLGYVGSGKPVFITGEQPNVFHLLMPIRMS